MRSVLRDHTEIAEDGSEEFDLRKEGIQQERRIDILVKILQHSPAQRRLTGADIAVNHDEAFTSMYAVSKQLECANVRRTVVKALRIRCQAERGFTKPVEFLVHVKS